MRSFSSDADETGGAASGPSQDLFVTETMAELSARQGRTADAIAIYRRLIAGAAAGERRERLERRLAALEGTAIAGAPAASSARLEAAPAPRSSASASVPQSLRPAPVEEPPAPILHTPLMVAEPVRSGQIVYAQGRDLLVLAPVNPGSQLMADGHIHVYGPLRGRAVAGVRGWSQAQVFCQRLEAELVGVDAAYLAADDLPVELLGKPARIWLDRGVCRVQRLPGS
jgi:septum site-determining protein MinC